MDIKTDNIIANFSRADIYKKYKMKEDHIQSICL